MIDYKKSAVLNNTTEEWIKTWFKKYPGSNKKVVVICENCGREREVIFRKRGILCPMCAHKHEKNTELLYQKAMEQWAKPGAREAARERALEYWADQNNRDLMSETMRKSPAVDRMRGGNDIIEHHVAYDFMRSGVLTVKVTRTYHGEIHHPKGCKFGTYGYSLID